MFEGVAKIIAIKMKEMIDVGQSWVHSSAFGSIDKVSPEVRSGKGGVVVVVAELCSVGDDMVKII